MHGASNEPEAYLEPSQISTSDSFFENSSIINVQLCSKYTSVNITLHLTFKKNIAFGKLMKFFKVLRKEKQNPQCASKRKVLQQF